MFHVEHYNIEVSISNLNYLMAFICNLGII